MRLFDDGQASLTHGQGVFVLALHTSHDWSQEAEVGDVDDCYAQHNVTKRHSNVQMPYGTAVEAMKKHRIVMSPPSVEQGYLRNLYHKKSSRLIVSDDKFCAVESSTDLAITCVRRKQKPIGIQPNEAFHCVCSKRFPAVCLLLWMQITPVRIGRVLPTQATRLTSSY